MSDPTVLVLGRLGNPLYRCGAALSDAELLDLLAHAEQLADLAERCARIGRTLANAAEDKRPTPYIVLNAYRQTIDRAVSELAQFRALVTELKSQIPTH